MWLLSFLCQPINVHLYWPCLIIRPCHLKDVPLPHLRPISWPMLWIPSPPDFLLALLSVILLFIYSTSPSLLAPCFSGLKKSHIPLSRQPSLPWPAKLPGEVISTQCFDFLTFHSLSKIAFSKVTSDLCVNKFISPFSVPSLFDLKQPLTCPF